MIQFIFNLTQVVVFSIWSIFLTFITGKLPKISAYHFDHATHHNSIFDICNDKYIKVNNSYVVSDLAKKKIISEFIDSLHKQEQFRNATSKTNFPMFDGVDIIGNRGFFSAIREQVDNYLKD